MVVRRAILLVFQVVVFAGSSAQNAKDSLESVALRFLEENQFEEAMEQFYLIHWEYRDANQPDSAIVMLEKALEIANRQQCCDSARAQLLTRVGQVYYRPLGNLPEALKYYQQALPLHLKHTDSISMGYAYWDIAKVEIDQGDAALALEHFNRSGEIFEQLDYQQGLLELYNSLGILYSKIAQYQKAIEYHLLAMKIIEESDGGKGNIALNYNNVGLSFKKMGKYDSALHYYQAGVELEKQERYPLLRAALFENIGAVLRKKQQYDSSLFYHSRAYAIGDDLGYVPIVGWGAVGMAFGHYYKGRIDQAIPLAQQGLKVAVDIGEPDMASQAAEVLALAYEAKGNFQQAFRYQQQFKTYSDSLFNAEEVKKITALEFELEIKKKEALSALERTAFDQALRQEQQIRNLAVGGLVITFMLGFLVYRSYVQKQKANQALVLRNEQIEAQATALSELNTQKNRLIGIISHDVRNPLSSLRSVTELLDPEILTSEKLEELKHQLIQRIDDLTGSVHTLLDWAKGQMDGEEMEVVSFDMQAIGDEMAKLFKDSLEKKGIAFHNRIVVESLVCGDINQVRAISRNLISNAIKFTPKEGQITLGAERKQNDHLLVWVRDTGVGMSKEQLENLFTPSITSSKGTAGEQGVGLGLMLVKDFVEKNKGTNWVESAVGKGSTFYFTLPVSN